MNRVLHVLASICAMTFLAAGCSTDHPTSPGARVTAPEAPSPMIIKPSLVPPPSPRTGRWVAELSNPWLGFEEGKKFHYRAVTPDGIETTVVEVTRQKKEILGVSTTVVHDEVRLNGSIIEDTFDWYAQDSEGNVWYFGEATQEYDNGVPGSTEGSWEAGRNGARPGIIMLADPKVGDSYQMENAPDVAEDQARVRSLRGSVQVPYGSGSFDNCLVIFEWTRLDRAAREYKYYAHGVGLLLVLEDKRNVRNELVKIEQH